MQAFRFPAISNDFLQFRSSKCVSMLLEVDGCESPTGWTFAGEATEEPIRLRHRYGERALLFPTRQSRPFLGLGAMANLSPSASYSP